MDALKPELPLPSFKNPPVHEVICGITFKPLAMLAPHLGILWEKFRKEYPTCREVDPLVPVIETYDNQEQPAPDLALPFMPRVWFISRDDNAIIQVQRDRFLHNWRKVRPSDEYPRYKVVREQFEQRLERFRLFLNENELGTICPAQFEMTYLNHLPAGIGWESIAHLGNVFPDFCWRTSIDRFLQKPEKLNFRFAFRIPEDLGRMHISISTATRRPDNVPVIIVELTVRGTSAECSIDSMWVWFDMARDWIVRGFTDITSPQMHAIWQREK